MASSAIDSSVKPVCMLLIQNGAQVNAQDNNGDSPLYEAHQRGLEKTGELLISKGATIDLKNSVSETPFSEPGANPTPNLDDNPIAKPVEQKIDDINTQYNTSDNSLNKPNASHVPDTPTPNASFSSEEQNNVDKNPSGELVTSTTSRDNSNQLTTVRVPEKIDPIKGDSSSPEINNQQISKIDDVALDNNVLILKSSIDTLDYKLCEFLLGLGSRVEPLITNRPTLLQIISSECPDNGIKCSNKKLCELLITNKALLEPTIVHKTIAPHSYFLGTQEISSIVLLVLTFLIWKIRSCDWFSKNKMEGALSDAIIKNDIIIIKSLIRKGACIQEQHLIEAIKGNYIDIFLELKKEIPIALFNKIKPCLLAQAQGNKQLMNLLGHYQELPIAPEPDSDANQVSDDETESNVAEIFSN